MNKQKLFWLVVIVILFIIILVVDFYLGMIYGQNNVSQEAIDYAIREGIKIKIIP